MALTYLLAVPVHPIHKKIAFLDTAASVSILGERAEANVATIQKTNISLNAPSQVSIFSTSSTQKARQALRVGRVPHNLVVVATLVDAGCSVHFYHWGFNIEYNGKTIYKGWRDPKTKLFQMIITDDGTPNIVPESDDVDLSAQTTRFQEL